MAKFKLTKLLKESLEESKKKKLMEVGTNFYLQKMDKSLEKLKALMRRDGYNV